MMYDEREQHGDLILASTDGHELKCHKNILIARSFFFESMFEFNDNMGEAVKLDFDKTMLVSMLEFIYLGET